jgi:type VI secretion system protein VasG
VRVDPKALVRHLDAVARRALEDGVALAVARTHYEVTVEHVLRRLVESQGDLPLVLRHFDVHAGRILAALDEVLEGMKTGNTGRPVFSPLLFSWFEDAYLVAAVEQGAQEVRAGHLLLALLMRPGRSALLGHTDELDKIDVEALRRELPQIVAGSAEEPRAAASGPGGPGRAVPRGVDAAAEEALRRFTIDVTARAAAGAIDPVLARDAEIRQMIDVLTRRRKNNPILIGEAGVGKTAVVEGFALRVASDDVPEPLRGVRVLNLDLGLLQAGAGVKGEFENRIKQVIHEVETALVPTIVFIDEAHTLIGAGGPAGGSDAAQLLKPALARGQLRTIAATTLREYKKYIEKDAALERRFQPITVAEPSVADAIVMLRGVKAKFEAHHGVHVLDDAVRAAVELSDRYISGRQLPDKAVDLLDTACARVSVGQSSKPPQLDDLERRLAQLDTAIAAVERDEEVAMVVASADPVALRAERARLRDEHEALAVRWQQEREAVARVRERQRAVQEAASAAPDPAPEPPAPPRATVAELRAALGQALAELGALQRERAMMHLHVDARVVARIVSDWTGIPVGNVLRDELTRLLELEDGLRRRVVGQDEAIGMLARRIRAAKAGLSPPQQPIGVFLLVGGSGVGKTETGLALAELLFGGERMVVTVNMSEFMEKHTVSRLIGSPPGYVGFGEGGVLTEAVRHHPYSVVLLDEVEKAHPEVMNLFHQVFDKGMLADGEGRVVDFKNTVLVMTSNLGTELIERELAGRAAGSPGPDFGELIEKLRPVLLQYFRPALLGRMTVVPYLPLPPEVLRTIIDMKLEKIGRRMAAEHGLRLEVTPAAREAILRRCDDPSSGARNIDHVLEQAVLPRISEEILSRMAAGEPLEVLTLGAGARQELTFTLGAAGAGAPTRAREPARIDVRTEAAHGGA